MESNLERSCKTIILIRGHHGTLSQRADAIAFSVNLMDSLEGGKDEILSSDEFIDYVSMSSTTNSLNPSMTQYLPGRIGSTTSLHESIPSAQKQNEILFRASETYFSRKKCS
jgi:hypothetical protein